MFRLQQLFDYTSSAGYLKGLVAMGRNVNIRLEILSDNGEQVVERVEFFDPNTSQKFGRSWWSSKDKAWHYDVSSRGPMTVNGVSDNKVEYPPTTPPTWKEEYWRLVDQMRTYLDNSSKVTFK